MQINQVSSALTAANDRPRLRPPSTREPGSSTGIPLPPRPVVQGPPTLVETSFGSALRGAGGTLPPATRPPGPGPAPLGLPAHVDQLETQVRDYRQTLESVHSDLITQLKADQLSLQQARQSGNQDAITAAQKAIADVDAQLSVNSNHLSVVHEDVKSLRELSQQLTADVKAGNLDSIQQDRNAVAEERAQVLADLQV